MSQENVEVARRAAFFGALDDVYDGRHLGRQGTVTNQCDGGISMLGRAMSYMRRHHLGLIALFFAVSGTSYAVGAQTHFVGGDGRVHACVRTRTGALRLVDTTARCSKGEQSVTWNQQGSKGASGPAGPQGGTGPAGPQGGTGPAGPQGGTGTPGASGAPGLDGSAIAFARVSGGALDDERSSNVLGVAAACKDNLPGDCAFRQPAKMCFDLGFKPSNAIATVEADVQGAESDFGIATATVHPATASGSFYCPAGFTDAAVVTLNSSKGTYSPFAFNVTFN